VGDARSEQQAGEPPVQDLAVVFGF
jgi:hypothetical protein